MVLFTVYPEKIPLTFEKSKMPKITITQEVLVGRDEFKIEIEKLTREQVLIIRDMLNEYYYNNNEASAEVNIPAREIVQAFETAVNDDPEFKRQFGY